MKNRSSVTKTKNRIKKILLKIKKHWNAFGLAHFDATQKDIFIDLLINKDINEAIMVSDYNNSLRHQIVRVRTKCKV